MWTGEGRYTITIISVQVISKNGVGVISTYAFMDLVFNTSFCPEEIACKLGVSVKKMTVNVDTMGMSHKLVTRKVKGLEVGKQNGGALI